VHFRLFYATIVYNWSNENEKDFGQNVNEVTGISGVDISAIDAWEIAKGAENIIIEMLDTGIEYSNGQLHESIYINTSEIANWIVTLNWTVILRSCITNPKTKGDHIMTQSKRPRRTFTAEFKHQLVQLYKNGKRKCDITKEYDVGYL